MALSPVNCSSQSIPYPTLPGATIRTLSASLARTAFQYIPAGLYANHDAVVARNTSYCNVTVTYTPLDSTNKTTVQVWLPTQQWNGRMQGLGGGGWSAGVFDGGYPGMLAAVAQGYTAVATNGGWTSNNPRGFALLRPGEVDIKSLKHFASTSLNDLSIIGKSVIKSFYGQPARYSYGNGCSQGGRQGFMLAQQYPRAFSGIAASSSAIRWASLMPAGFWAQALMHDMGKYPNPCEVSTLSAAAMKACDGNDGVMDGLISDPDSCHFDPYTLVNTTTSCFGTKNIKISKEAAYLAHTAWTGMKASNQSFLHDGNTYEAAIVTAGAPLLDSVFTRLNITIGLADRQCNANGTCIGRPLDLVDDWIRYFVVKDPNYDSSKMTMKEFNAIFETSKREYTDIIGTGATDLSGFRKVGGKLLSYHGLADPMIPSKNSRHYFEDVMAGDPSVHSYFRHFEAPGVGHCYSASGLYPSSIFDNLVNWVEKGQVPDKLEFAVSALTGPRNARRILCPYPQRARFNGSGDPWVASNFHCA